MKAKALSKTARKVESEGEGKTGEVSDTRAEITKRSRIRRRNWERDKGNEWCVAIW